MRLASNNLARNTKDDAANDVDPREQETADVIDLASRNAFPAVTQRRNKSDGLGLAAGVAFVGLIGAVTLWSMNSTRLAEPESVGNPQIAAPVQAPAPTPVQPLAQPILPQPDPAPAPIYANQPVPYQGVAVNPYASPTIVFDASGAPVPLVSGPPAIAVPGAQSDGSSNDFASRIGGIGGAPAMAMAMSNPTTTVTQGTLIPAILETAIETDVPGYVRAVVSQDVRSFDGSKVLVPRSSRLIGQYQSGLQGGQKRAYVIWTRLIRPDGASVNLASPAIGFDGTTGLAGDVNSHFFKRFGSAMLLSVIDGLTAVASGGTSLILGGGKSAASTALEQDGKISPTVRVRQGEPIRVFTARDLDFSQVSGG
jgi:type IV secretion system protein VirB10